MDILRVLGNNLRYKLLALLFAVIFWFWVTGQIHSFSLVGNQSISLAVELTNLPSNYVVLSDLPVVTVQLKGDNPKLSTSDLYVYVDLQEASVGTAPYAVRIDPPEGVSIKSISPHSVRLTVDRVTRKRVPVDLQVIGTPAVGYEIGTPIISPNEADVYGPATVLEKLSKVAVEVDVNGIQRTLSQHEPVLFKDFEGSSVSKLHLSQHYLRASPETIEVTVPVYEQGQMSKKVPVTVQTTGTLAAGMEIRSIEPVPASVELYGLPGVLQEVTGISLGTISVANLNADKMFEINTSTINLPEGVRMPETVKFNVLVSVRTGIQQKVVHAVPVEVRNKKTAEFVYSAIEPINVTVSGYPEFLITAQASSLGLWINAASLGEGTHTVDLLWDRMPTGVTPVHLPKITITVTPIEPPVEPGDPVESADPAEPITPHG